MSPSKKQIRKRIALCFAIAASFSLAAGNARASDSELIRLAVVSPDVILAEQFWNTNGTSALWTASNWGASAGGPFTSGWTAGNNANFTATSLITYVSNTSVANINVTNSSTVTLTAAGTYNLGSAIRTFDVGTGSILDFAAQGMSTAAGSGIIKNGGGIYFSSNGTSSSLPGGFTLNAGTVIIGGTLAMGTGPLTINGGTLAANASRAIPSGRFTSVTIGGNFTMGAVTTGVGSGNGISTANISIADNASLGAATRTITIGSNATYSLLGILSGSSGTGLNVAASGGATGNLVLSGANTFNGGTTVNSGILALGSSSTASGGALINGPVGTGLLTLNSGATLRSSNTIDRTILNNVSLSGNVTMGDATNTGVLNFNSTGLNTPSTMTLAADTVLTTNSNVRIGNKITGAGRSLTKMGSGMLDLDVANDFSGTFTASGGTTNLNVNNALGSVTSVVVNSGANLFSIGDGSTTNVINDAASVTINGTGNLDLSGGSETLGSLASSSASSTLVIGKFGTFAGSLTVGDSSNTTFAGVISGDPLVAGTTIFTKQGSGTLTLSGANTYGGGTLLSAGGLNINNSGSGGTSSAIGTGTLTIANGTTIDNTSGSLVTLSTNNKQNWIGDFTFTGSNNLNLGTGAVGLNSSTRQVTVTAGTLTVGGVIGDGLVSSPDPSPNKKPKPPGPNIGPPVPPLVASGITKAGAGTLVLSGANTYSGTTSINGGILNLGSSGALGSIGNITFGGGILQYSASNTTDYSTRIKNSTGSIALDTNGQTVGYFSALDSSNTGGLTKLGAGTFSLLAANTYTGDTIIKQGDLRINQSGSIVSSSSIRLGDTIANSPTALLTLGPTNGINVASALEVRASASGTQGVRDLRTLSIDGTDTYSGAITMNADLTAQASTGGTLLLSGGSVDVKNHVLTVDSRLDGTGGVDNVNVQGTVRINEVLGSSLATGGSLVKDGSGTLILQGISNTYTGTDNTALNASGTRIGGGVLGIYGDGSLGLAPSGASNNIFFTASAISSSVGPTLQDTANNVTLASTRNINVASGVTARLDSNGNTFTVNGVINGSGGNIAKIGAGTLVLNGDNTYTGTTTVSAGTLLVNGDQSAATGAVTVNNSGTTLGGSGTIGGSVTVNSGANLAPGASTGILRTGALTLNSSSNFVVELNGTTAGTGYDQVVVTGAVNLLDLSFTGLPNLVVNVGGSLSINDTFFVVLNDGTDLVTGTFAQGATVTSGSYMFLINYLDNGDGGSLGNDISLTVTAIPEPGTWIGAALALAAVGFTQRRRFKRALARVRA